MFSGSAAVSSSHEARANRPCCWLSFFFFNDTATTEIYTLSLHDALPIYKMDARPGHCSPTGSALHRLGGLSIGDRKSTRLNSSHANISYAVFCLKKKKMRQAFAMRSRCIWTYPTGFISFMITGHAVCSWE